MPEGQYLAVDLETTGLDPSRNSIIEIGAVPLDEYLNRRPDVEPFHTYVQPWPDAEVAQQALAVNKQFWVNKPESDEYKRALPYRQAWEAFWSFLYKHYGDNPKFIVLVGWNVSFDEGFLKRMCVWSNVNERVAIHDDALKKYKWPFHWHKIDLLGVCRYLDARKGRPPRKSYRLEALAEHYYSALAKFAAHTAMGDCELQLKVLEAIEKEDDTLHQSVDPPTHDR